MDFLTTEAHHAPFLWGVAQMVREILVGLLGDTHNYLPRIGGSKHVEVNLDVVLVDASTPCDVAHDFFPVVMAAVSCLVVVGEDDVGTMKILGPDPWYFGTITMAKFL